MLLIVILGMILAGLSEQYSLAAPKLSVTVLLTAALAIVPAVAAGLLMLYFTAKKRRLGATDEPHGTAMDLLSRRFRATSKALDALVLVSYAGALASGWSSLPARFGIDAWYLPSRALLILPFILSLVLTWAVVHVAEGRLAGAGPTMAQRLSFKLRHGVLTLLVPVSIILAFYDLAALLPESVQSFFERAWIITPLAGALILAAYVLAPLLVVRIWKTSHLDDCPLRRELVELCGHIGVKFRDIRVWETPGHFFANAAVMGITGFSRYIIISRSLMTAMPREELAAVFAHELGHAKRRHMLYYLAFALDFMLLLALFEMLMGADGAALLSGTAGSVALVVAAGLYWGVGFGYVSRTFERDADLFGAETAGNFPLFATALQRIANLNGTSPAARSWRHGSIRGRVEFLLSAADNIQVRRHFLTRLAFIKVFLVTLAFVTLSAILLVAYPWP